MIRQNTGTATGTLYPADRCTWRHVYNSTTGQYDISDAMFHGATAIVDLEDDVTLGFIGKSGRFVPITE